MKIYIPTLNRSDKITWNGMPDKYKENVTMLIQEHETEKHKKYDCEKIVLPDNIGIAKTRVHIYNHAIQNKEEHFAMLDDDIKYYRRNQKYYGLPSDMPKSNRPNTEEDWDEMYELFSEWLSNDVSICGNAHSKIHPGNKEYRDNAMMVSSYYIRTKDIATIMEQEDLSAIDTSEDMLLLMSFYTRGYRGRFSSIFAHYPIENINSGGCQTWRTKEIDSASDKYLSDKYPKYAKHLPNGKMKFLCAQAYKESNKSYL